MKLRKKICRSGRISEDGIIRKIKHKMSCKMMWSGVDVINMRWRPEMIWALLVRQKKMLNENSTLVIKKLKIDCGEKDGIGGPHININIQENL